MEQLNSVFLFGYELLHRTTAVDGMSICDKEYIPCHLLQQPLEKSDHHTCGEPLSEHHEPQGPAVTNATDHATTESPAGYPHNRRLTSGRKATSNGCVRPHTHLITPLDLGVFCLGHLLDGGIFLFNPMLHFLGTLLKSLTSGLLRCKTPLLQVAPHLMNRITNAKPLLDKLTHCLTRPQIEGQLQLVWMPVSNQVHYGGTLPRLKLASPTGTPSRFGLQAFFATFTIGSQPTRNGTTAYSENLGRLRLHHPCLNRRHSAYTNCLLRFWSNTAKVLTSLHASSIPQNQSNGKYLLH